VMEAEKTVAASLRRQRLVGISPRTCASATTVVDLDAPEPRTW
jgi:putative transposase